MSGILRYGSYIPYFRLDRQAAGIGRGERAIASYDEDSVSMAVEAGRQALGGAAVDTLMFATTSPPYAEKLN
ncbi:MAG: hydroxymethylglutaryl-CoA synthase, partial [Gammaproteobacteria bacterium]